MQRVQSRTIRIIVLRRTAPNFAMPGFGQKNKVGSLAKSALQEHRVQSKALTAASCANSANQDSGRHLAQRFARRVPPELFPSLVGRKCVLSARWGHFPPVAPANVSLVSLEPMVLQWVRSSASHVHLAHHRHKALSLKSSARHRARLALGPQLAERRVRFVTSARTTTRLDPLASRVASAALLEPTLTSLECGPA